MKKLNNFIALVSALIFIVLLRVENSSFSNESSHWAFYISLAALVIFGSIYLFNKYEAGNIFRTVEGSSGEEGLSSIKNINVSIIKWSLISMSSFILIGLGIYGVYCSEDLFGVFTEDNKLYYKALIVLGVLVEAIVFLKLIPLWKQRADLLRNG